MTLVGLTNAKQGKSKWIILLLALAMLLFAGSACAGSLPGQTLEGENWESNEEIENTSDTEIVNPLQSISTSVTVFLKAVNAHVMPVSPAIAVLLYKIGICSYWKIPIKYIKVSDSVSQVAIGASVIFFLNRSGEGRETPEIIHPMLVALTIAILVSLFILHDNSEGSDGKCSFSSKLEYMTQLVKGFRTPWIWFSVFFIALGINNTSIDNSYEHLCKSGTFLIMFGSICAIAYFIGKEFPVIAPYGTIATITEGIPGEVETRISSLDKANNHEYAYVRKEQIQKNTSHTEYLVVGDYADSLIAVKAHKAVDSEYYMIPENEGRFVFIPMDNTQIRKGRLYIRDRFTRTKNSIVTMILYCLHLVYLLCMLMDQGLIPGIIRTKGTLLCIVYIVRISMIILCLLIFNKSKWILLADLVLYNLLSALCFFIYTKYVQWSSEWASYIGLHYYSAFVAIGIIAFIQKYREKKNKV